MSRKRKKQPCVTDSERAKRHRKLKFCAIHPRRCRGGLSLRVVRDADEAKKLNIAVKTTYRNSKAVLYPGSYICPTAMTQMSRHYGVTSKTALLACISKKLEPEPPILSRAYFGRLLGVLQHLIQNSDYDIPHVDGFVLQETPEDENIVFSRHVIDLDLP
mmetsp:Transcript_28971/g.32184  ORF Transcript_28971/g.32184 Transcript_28971/m.32184 type:complete len:160 (-) Transcript_28971:101-580(-)|eukprot:CAMPEP_0168518354 /NCGR_PEP_ID=MMETSP0405-20121227/6657_1 /TAXON_ID=498012 /ORGANISM="Trichosphaerium sp, Strain Am-I-7 wt" /LENGTH=159 /DNA_ID=CAMNT_0008538659 /DNA_START=210 /DNA_END=689 /DNA_ORIENTATION=+